MIDNEAEVDVFVQSLPATETRMTENRKLLYLLISYCKTVWPKKGTRTGTILAWKTKSDLGWRIATERPKDCDSPLSETKVLHSGSGYTRYKVDPGKELAQTCSFEQKNTDLVRVDMFLRDIEVAHLDVTSAEMVVAALQNVIL